MSNIPNVPAVEDDTVDFRLADALTIDPDFDGEFDDYDNEAIDCLMNDTGRQAHRYQLSL